MRAMRRNPTSSTVHAGVGGESAASEGTPEARRRSLLRQDGGAKGPLPAANPSPAAWSAAATGRGRLGPAPTSDIDRWKSFHKISAPPPSVPEKSTTVLLATAPCAHPSRGVPHLPNPCLAGRRGLLPLVPHVPQLEPGLVPASDRRRRLVENPGAHRVEPAYLDGHVDHGAALEARGDGDAKAAQPGEAPRRRQRGPGTRRRRKAQPGEPISPYPPPTPHPQRVGVVRGGCSPRTSAFPASWYSGAREASAPEADSIRSKEGVPLPAASRLGRVASKAVRFCRRLASGAGVPGGSRLIPLGVKPARRRDPKRPRERGVRAESRRGHWAQGRTGDRRSGRGTPTERGPLSERGPVAPRPTPMFFASSAAAASGT